MLAAIAVFIGVYDTFLFLPLIIVVKDSHSEMYQPRSEQGKRGVVILFRNTSKARKDEKNEKNDSIVAGLGILSNGWLCQGG